MVIDGTCFSWTQARCPSRLVLHGNLPLGVMRILAISGSLRAASINSALLRTAARLAPPEIEVALCSVVGELPLFNPDLELRVPSSVARLRAQVAAADALLIASPEYAHGVTGTIKNALDWLVSFEPFGNKPVAVLNAPPIAQSVRESLAALYSAVVLQQPEHGPSFPVDPR
jgi:chromate reductase